MSAKTPASDRNVGGQLDRLIAELRGGGSNIVGLLGLWALLIAIFTFLLPGTLLQATTLQAMMFQLPELGLLSLAMAIPLVSGGLNLAIIATTNQSALLMAWLLTTQMPADASVSIMWIWVGLAVVAGLLHCVFVGVTTGVIIAVLRVHPILVTLGTQTLIGGITIWLTRGRTLSGFPEPILHISNETIVGIPVSFVVFAVVAIAVHVLLTRTPLGVRIHMMGSNSETTRYSGVNTTRVQVWVYMLSSVLCWLAALIMMGRFNSAGADIAQSYLLITILAAILGGIDPYGGFGRVAGLVTSLLILQTISSGFNLLGLSPHLTLALWGFTLLAVMGVKRLAASLSHTPRALMRAELAPSSSSTANEPAINA